MVLSHTVCSLNAINPTSAGHDVLHVKLVLSHADCSVIFNVTSAGQYNVKAGSQYIKILEVRDVTCSEKTVSRAQSVSGFQNNINSGGNRGVAGGDQ